MIQNESDIMITSSVLKHIENRFFKMPKSIKPVNENSWVESWFFNKIWTYERFNAGLCQALNNQIAGGFCKGMEYVSSVPWTRLVVNRLVGTYEMELLPFFQSLDHKPPRVIFDIGAAEGFYAVGSLVRWNTAEVYAWETEPQSRKIMQTIAEKNNVHQRLHIREACTQKSLKQSIFEKQPELIIMDIEGAEAELCVPDIIDLSRNSFWVIECHSPQIMDKLKGQFNTTHTVEIVRNRTLSFEDVKVKLPLLYTLFPQDRWRVVREGRAIATPWLIARPKTNDNTR